MVSEVLLVVLDDAIRGYSNRKIVGRRFRTWRPRGWFVAGLVFHSMATLGQAKSVYKR